MGQRSLLAMGNGVMTRYAYDAENFRIKRLKSEKYTQTNQDFIPTTSQLATTSVFQDMGYQYDLGGNIRGLQEHIKDCGTGATPNALLSQFNYDPIKRLLSATGRESDTQTNDSFWTEKAKPNAPNAEHTRNYMRTYDGACPEPAEGTNSVTSRL